MKKGREEGQGWGGERKEKKLGKREGGVMKENKKKNNLRSQNEIYYWSKK